MEKIKLENSTKNVLFLMCCTKGLITGDTSWHVMDGYSKSDLISMLLSSESEQSVKRNWVNIELNDELSLKLRKSLNDKKVKYETSGVGNLTHFEVYASDAEVYELNKLMDEMENEDLTSSMFI